MKTRERLSWLLGTLPAGNLTSGTVDSRVNNDLVALWLYGCLESCTSVDGLVAGQRTDAVGEQARCLLWLCDECPGVRVCNDFDCE